MNPPNERKRLAGKPGGKEAGRLGEKEGEKVRR